MSDTKTASVGGETGSKAPRTRLGDLSTTGHELSRDDIELVAGGLTQTGAKVPLDDDATYVPGVPHHYD